MQILKPTVGPILGRTSHAEANIFIRGDAAPQGTGFGLLQYRDADGHWSAPQVQPLDPLRDHTCVFRLNGLQPTASYVYRTGWTPDPSARTNLPSQGDWPAGTPPAFRTGTSDPQAPRSYALGSCRHLSSPLQPDFDPAGDRIFGSIRAKHENGRRLDAFFMLGDQVYADPPFAAPVTQRHQFLALYRCTFTHEHLGGLMSRVPTYMILDDHEIQENWPADVDPEDKAALEQAALDAYRIYQGSHNPAAAAHAWYAFEDGCCEWFVMDTRCERDPRQGTMVSPQQLAALCSFLANGSGRVKMVATTVPIFPDHAFYPGDKWQGFPLQRRQIFDCIRQHRVPKVVFVAGDVHCSFGAGLALDARTTVHTVVCSPFVASIPFGAIWWTSFHRRMVDAGTSAKPELLSDGTFWRRNFAHLSVHPDRMQVSFYDRAGEPLQEDLQIVFA